MTKYRLCVSDGPNQVFDDSNTKDIIATFEIRGYHYTGAETNRNLRAELHGHPKFAELIGPMWDGDGIRYEDQATYNALSA